MSVSVKILIVLFLLFAKVESPSLKATNTESLGGIGIGLFINFAAASSNEEEEEIEHIEVNGDSPDDWDWEDDHWDNWDDDECSNSSVCDHDGDDNGDVNIPETKEVCYATADRDLGLCKRPALKDHLDAVNMICPFAVDVEFGIRYIFGTVAVRSFDSCVNTANALKELEFNKCDIFHADDRVQCAKLAN